MDKNLNEYAPYWLVGYYHLERKTAIEVDYIYHTTVITIHEFFFGVQCLLEKHHSNKQVIIVYIQAIDGFKQNLQQQNIYVNFKTIAQRLVENELMTRCSSVNEKYQETMKAVLNDQGLVEHEILSRVNNTVKNIVKKEISEELVARVSSKLEKFWTAVALPALLSHR